MLKTTLKKNESVMIGNNISVKVISLGGGRVQIGIEAPDHLVMPEKLIEKARQEQEAERRAACAADKLEALVMGKAVA